MGDSQAWVTVRNFNSGFGPDATWWTTEVFEDGVLVQEVDVDRDTDEGWHPRLILKPEHRHESHIIQLPAEELAELRRLASRIDLDELRSACPMHIDDLGSEHIEIRTADRLAKYRGQLFANWHYLDKANSPHVDLVRTAIELWDTVVRLSPFKDLKRPKAEKRPRGPGRYRKS